MKNCAFTLAAGLALAGISLGITACTQAPVAAAPADTSAPAPVVVEEHRRVVVEENHPQPAVDINVQKRDGDHTSVDIRAHP